MKKFFSLGFFFIATALFAKEVSFLPEGFTSDFEQIQKSTLSGKEKTSSGKIYYKYPSHIRFEVLKPDEVVFVSNPEKTWYYTAPFVKGESGELTVSATRKLPLVKFFDFLKKGLSSNELYTVSEQNKVVTFTFKEASQKDLGIKSAELRLTKEKNFSSLESLVLSKMDNAKVTIKFLNLKIQKDFPKERFEFTPPANTKVSQ